MKQANDQFLQVFLEEALEMMDNWETLCLNLDHNPTTEDLNALFRCAHTLKGSSKAVYLTEFGATLHKIEDVINQLREGKLTKDRTLEALLDWQRELKNWLLAIRKKQDYPFDQKKFELTLSKLIEQTPPQAVEEEFIEFSKLGKSEEPATKSEPSKEGQVQAAPGGFFDTPEKQESVPDAAINAKMMIRVDSKKCDALLHSVGEMALNFEVLKRIIGESPGLAEKVAHTINSIESINSNLQRDVLAIRMQPLDQFFQRMQRLAKDVSRTLSKKVRVVVHGKAVELDKTVSDKLVDPFVHIIRNALDHGIETPDVRKAAGKLEEGLLELTAKSTPSGVEITVKDDGKGLDRDKILERAIEKNLVAKGTQLSNDKIFELITRPGFTTADKVSDISGRGIGMDVVAKSIKDLGGTMQIHSQLGQGTRFVFNLPTNLSILDAFIVVCSGVRFAVLVQEIAQIVDLNECQLKSAQGYEILNHNEKIIPVHRLAQIFELEERRIDNSGHRPAILTDIDETRVAFEVDAVVGKQKIVISDNPQNISVPGVAGMTILDDALPGVIVSIQSIARQLA